MEDARTCVAGPTGAPLNLQARCSSACEKHANSIQIMFLLKRNINMATARVVPFAEHFVRRKPLKQRGHKCDAWHGEIP